jgi:hypothetical protein
MPAFRQQTDYRGTHRWTAFPKDLKLSRSRMGATFTARSATARRNPRPPQLAASFIVSAAIAKTVLACFNPQWPKLNFTVA